MARTRIDAWINRSRRAGRRGAVVVEVAAVLPLCLVLLLSTFDFGRLVMTQNLLNNAARAGARLAVTNTTTLATSDIQNCVTQCMAGQSLVNMSISVYQVNPSNGANLGTWTNTPLGGYIAVEIDGNFQPVLPGLSLIPSPLPTTVKAMMLCEAN
jgi:Flp pilus assembly protein TadG